MINSTKNTCNCKNGIHKCICVIIFIRIHFDNTVYCCCCCTNRNNKSQYIIKLRRFRLRSYFISGIIIFNTPNLSSIRHWLTKIQIMTINQILVTFTRVIIIWRYSFHRKWFDNGTRLDPYCCRTKNIRSFYFKLKLVKHFQLIRFSVLVLFIQRHVGKYRTTNRIM